MFKFALLAILFCLAGCSSRLPVSAFAPTTSPATSPPGALSPQNTRITFIGSALAASHEGTFTRFSGQLDCPDSDPTDAHIVVEIEMDSITTDIPLLTKHLKESDFFEVKKYPTARFVSTRIQPGANPTIAGDFTIHGVTKSLMFPAKFQTDGRTITLDATITIRQSDFAMQSARITNDDVPVTVSIRVRQP